MGAPLRRKVVQIWVSFMRNDENTVLRKKKCLRRRLQRGPSPARVQLADKFIDLDIDFVRDNILTIGLSV